jgi:nucleoside-diphosphate-sugar epimerase
MKTLVTGGTGFIGSAVVDLLAEQGHSVRLFSRKKTLPARLTGKDVELFHGDLKEPDSVLSAMRGMEVFYHIGELKNTSPGVAEKNVQLVERIVGHLEQSGVKRMVFISSLTVAGLPSKIPATEETLPAVMLEDHYTRYKQRCEKLLAEKAVGAAYAVVRPGIVYGSGSRYLGSLITAIGTIGPVGFPFIGKGKNRMPLIHVQDLARAITLAGVEQNAAGQTFNLVDGMGRTWLDFFTAIARSLGKNFRIIPFPVLALRGPAVFLDVLSGLFSVRFSMDSYVRYAASDLLFDITKAKQVLHWAPEYDLEKGVEEMVRGSGRDQG